MALLKSELIVRSAQAAHEATRNYLCAIGDLLPREWDVPWMELSDDLQLVGMRMAERIFQGERDRSVLHASWVEDMLGFGWQWGLRPEGFEHPCIVDFRDLPEHQRNRIDLALSISLGVMARFKS